MEKGIYKNIDFLLLLQGQFISSIGNAVHSITITLFILQLTNKTQSGLFLSLLSCCLIIPAIVTGPVSGVFVDRFDRKFIIVCVDFLSGVLIFLLFLSIHYNYYPWSCIFIITGLSSLLSCFLYPAIRATIPNILHHDDLIKANSISGISSSISYIIGAAIAGYLYYKIEITGVLLLNSVSFVLSGFFSVFISIPESKLPPNNFSNFLFELTSGFLYIGREKPILILLIISVFINLLYTPFMGILLPQTIKFYLNMETLLGLLLSFSAVGGLVGMIILTIKNIKKEFYYLITRYSIITIAVIPILFSIPMLFGARNEYVYIFFCVLVFINGVACSLMNIPFFSIFQKIIPDEHRGKFFALFITVSQVAAPIGNIVYGYFSVYFSTACLIISVGVFLLFVSVVLITSQSVKLVYQKI